MRRLKETPLRVGGEEVVNDLRGHVKVVVAGARRELDVERSIRRVGDGGDDRRVDRDACIADLTYCATVAR